MNENEPCETVPQEEIRGRIDCLKKRMADEGIDFALICQNVDKYYFTGTLQKGVLAVAPGRDPILLIEKSVERARAETPLPFITVGSDREGAEILKKEGIIKGVAGLELDVLPVALYERLKGLLGFTRHADVAPSVKELRAIKSPFELDQIGKSGSIMTRVFEKAKDVIREGITELEIDAALTAEGRRLGHQGFLRMRGINQEMMTITVQAGFSSAITTTYADSPITGMGVTPAVPIGSSFKKVEKGVPVTIDYGGGYHGYTTDETRVFVVGELQELFRKPYDAAHEILEDLLSYGAPGVDCRDLYARALRIVKNAGLEHYFMGSGEGQVSFIGHGLGLEINELPFITARHGTILEEGMVFAFEPKFVLPPHGAIGIEIDVKVGPRRLERITGDSFEIVRL
ncbi:MAG TPA: Xaa-Pro peptidase family protein [Syntrophorhabdaceae bacterium]|jgi:Xaa-Pro aminopeptidase